MRRERTEGIMLSIPKVLNVGQGDSWITGKHILLTSNEIS